MPSWRICSARAGLLALALVCATASCGGPAPSDRPGAEAATSAPAAFTIRGRCADARDLRVRVELGSEGERVRLAVESEAEAEAGVEVEVEVEVESGGAALEGDRAALPALGPALDAACAAWAEDGAVALRRVATGAADVVVRWASPARGERAMGADSCLARTGPAGPGSVVELDATRAWTAAELEAALVHELGHALGLGHSGDPRAVMHADLDATKLALAAADRAGLASLYGGGIDGPGDLVIGRAGNGEEIAPALRAVAPPDTTDFAVVGTDLDGDAEIVVWRTDRAGHGAVLVFHFAPDPAGAGPRLARTVGPMLGMVVPGARVDVLGGPDRALVSTLPDGRRLVRRFDEHGALHAAGELPPVGGTDPKFAGLPERGDLDGDGRLETVRRRGE